MEEVGSGTRFKTQGMLVQWFINNIIIDGTHIIPSFLNRSLWPLGIVPLIIPEWLLLLQPFPIPTCRKKKSLSLRHLFFKSKNIFQEASQKTALCISLIRSLSRDTFKTNYWWGKGKQLLLV